jgi:hypothetical protein
MGSLRKLYILAGVLDIRFIQHRTHRIRQELIDTSSGHDIAAKEHADSPSCVHVTLSHDA